MEEYIFSLHSEASGVEEYCDNLPAQLRSLWAYSRAHRLRAWCDYVTLAVASATDKGSESKMTIRKLYASFSFCFVKFNLYIASLEHENPVRQPCIFVQR
jgi:hypothetical protein